MPNQLTPAQIIADLKSRGEYNIRFKEDGFIYSKHGQSTFNTWMVKDNELVCVDCRTIY